MVNLTFNQPLVRLPKKVVWVDLPDDTVVNFNNVATFTSTDQTTVKLYSDGSFTLSTTEDEDNPTRLTITVGYPAGSYTITLSSPGYDDLTYGMDIV